jgi:hypothetical protein
VVRDAAVKISGTELAHEIKKGQFDTSELRPEGRGHWSFGKPFWQRKFDQDTAAAYFSHPVCAITINPLCVIFAPAKLTFSRTPDCDWRALNWLISL